MQLRALEALCTGLAPQRAWCSLPHAHILANIIVFSIEAAPLPAMLPSLEALLGQAAKHLALVRCAASGQPCWPGGVLNKSAVVQA